ncbi:hypothetical protein SLEP1_g10316 [Rubroshorea leprosula]|uniref:Uncharacterized protein n=1 Tax=Rubroshorea leprosula TaxID=152421 RepID=A0AAV5IC89_9ROSI|nr:hypothetical protein SLEP1_g10316 [Rubroshorea leprosula]
MLKFCTSCSTSALMAYLGCKCLNSAARAQVLHFMLNLDSKCLSSALRARPLKLMVDFGCKCLNSAAHAQVLHFVLDLGSNSCFSISHLGLVRFVAWTSAIRSLCSSKTFMTAHAQVGYLHLVLQRVVSARARARCLQLIIVKLEDNGISGISDFDDEDGELEALADGAGVGSHVSGEPVDDSTIFGTSQLHALTPFLFPSFSLSPTK